ncbi:MAG: isopentenyl phosphate kinase [Candidatus Diapherotrites archaeon]
MKLIILKSGGSVCTEKDRNKVKAKIPVIKRVASEIKAAQRKQKFKLVLVHGAGPFGHQFVHNYGVKNGVKKTNKKQIEGFVRTHNSMEDLNKIFMDVFRKEGLLGFPIQTSACVVQKNKTISKFDTAIIKELLKFENVIPIMYGDMVIDTAKGATVVSGDALISFLAKKLNADLVLLGADLDGIFTADPKKNKKAKLIEKINSKNFKEVLSYVKEASTIDVTRGMKGKLLEIKKIANKRKVIVFNLNKKNYLYNLLIGKKVISTEIKL